MKKTIIKSSLSAHQRFILILFFSVFFLLGILECLGLASSAGELYAGDYIILFLFVLSFGILILLLSKQGIVIDNRKLFSAQFIFGKPYSIKELDLDGMTDVSILNYNISQKLVFVSAAKPDFAEKIRLSRIFLLNENHSQKRLVLSSNKPEQAEAVMNAIKNEFDLDHNAYNPPVARRRRR